MFVIAKSKREGERIDPVDERRAATNKEKTPLFMRCVKEEKTIKYLETTVQLQYKFSYSYTIYKTGGVYMTGL